MATKKKEAKRRLKWTGGQVTYVCPECGEPSYTAQPLSWGGVFCTTCGWKTGVKVAKQMRLEPGADLEKSWAED